MLRRPDHHAVLQLVRMALEEDAPWGDLTSDILVPANERLSAELRAREDGILCGGEVFSAAMSLSGSVSVEFSLDDGQHFSRGQTLATIHGPARAILRAERVALNFTQHLCGIATLTAKYVSETRGTRARIVDTRKTTPGLRLFERYAVRCGGGYNHRFCLSDAVLAKDNHLAALNASAAEDLTSRLRSAFANLPHTVHVEVEVDRLDQIEPVLAAGAHTIMLDNFTVDELRAGVLQIAGRALVEASGGITLDRIRDIAATGVDLISVGALTNGVRSIDLGLDVASS